MDSLFYTIHFIRGGQNFARGGGALATPLCVRVWEVRHGSGLVLAVGFLFDLDIFLKIFFNFSPDFFNFQIVY
jgi:hypothetical protein